MKPLKKTTKEALLVATENDIPFDDICIRVLLK